MSENGLMFEKITREDIIPFIRFLDEANPDYPYRWFFDPFWIASKVEDQNYIWGVLKPVKDPKKVVGTVICYYEPEKKIDCLKLLLVHPQYRGKGVLNNIFFKRLRENRVVDQIQAHQPNLLFAEILVNRLTSQKMVQKIGMSFFGYYPCKTRRDDVRLDLVPCGLLFRKDFKVIDIDDRIAQKVESILKINGLMKYRDIRQCREECPLTWSENPLREVEIRAREQDNRHAISIDGSNFLTYHHNTYINTISEAKLTIENPENAHVLIRYLKKLDAEYTEVMIPLDLTLQDVLLQNEFYFTAFLPYYWNGDDALVFSLWKNRPFFLPKTKKVYLTIMEVNEFG